MKDVNRLITEHLDIWLTAETEKKSGRGRRSGSANSIYGVQKLRELIFDCAIRGLLTHQNENDNADKIILELSQVIEYKNNCKVVDYGSPFQNLPQNWCLTNLLNISYINPRNQVKDDDVDASFIPMTLIPQIYSGKHLSEKKKWKDIKKAFTHFKSNDIGIAKITPCFENSKACVFEDLENDIGAGTTELHIVRPIKYLESKYVLIFFKSPTFLSLGEQYMTGTAGQKRLPKEFVSFSPFPLPPLEEQQRIVAKVDELMKLCDQLEQQQNLSSEAHDQLVDTLLSILTNSSDADEFQQNWQRISENFHLLFTTEYSIEQLKQTILQLAVMGKLVKQDPNDEPASELLKKIADEKAKLIKEGILKKRSKNYRLPPIKIDFPNDWNLVNIDQIIWNLDAGWSPACYPYPAKADKWGVLKTTFVQCNYFIENENKELPNELSPREDSELQSGDILVTRAGPYNRVGVACYVDNIRPKLMISDKLIRISYSNLNLYGAFIALAINFGITRDYLKDNQSGMAESQVNISQEKLREAPILLPPLNEQKRIVEKVNQLFSMIEKLQKIQGKLQRTKIYLADSLIASALSDSNDKSESETTDNIIQFEKPIEIVKQSNQKSADQIDLFTDESVDDDIKLLSLAAEITFQLHTELTFGHLKLQKLIYLCQQLKHMDLAADFKQHAAGPYDPVMARYLDQQFKDRQWFSYDLNHNLKYKPLKKCNEHRSAFDKYFAKDVSEIYHLIGLFRTSKSEHIEIVATLFACWLRLLEKKLSVTEEQLLKDFYAWSKEKKEFSQNEVLNGLKWMKQNAVVPL